MVRSVTLTVTRNKIHPTNSISRQSLKKYPTLHTPHHPHSIKPHPHLLTILSHSFHLQTNLTEIVAQKKLNTEPVKKITKAKAKKEKHPAAPKRSVFFVFMEKFRKEFKKNFPDNKSIAVVAKEGGAKWKAIPKVAKEGGAKWKATSESEKTPYVEKAASKKAGYEDSLKNKEEVLSSHEEMISYYRNHGEELNSNC